MESSPWILADRLVPWFESPLPPLTLRLEAPGTTCLIGAHSEHLTAYLRTLGGIDPPLSGSLQLFGEPLEGMGQRQWQQLRPRLGFVTRTAPLLSVLNGLDNITLPALYHRHLTRPQARRRAEELLQELAFEADTNSLPAYLSPLQRTQLAIARAAILSPPVLFLEEPFHGLDASEYGGIEPFLRRWSEQQALVVSTRNLRFVKRQGQQILFAAAEKILYFDNWAALTASTNRDVQKLLRNYRDNHHI
ncbi:MAG: ATP-binding cassette domain-containing protein [Pseudomonadota bacterium]